MKKESFVTFDEQKHLADMERVKLSIKKTESFYAKRDYGKKLKKMEKELESYRRWSKS